VAEKVAQVAIKFPPMQPAASFNVEAVKGQIEEARAGARTVSASHESSLGRAVRLHGGQRG
jgi:hypothetical protein